MLTWQLPHAQMDRHFFRHGLFADRSREPPAAWPPPSYWRRFIWASLNRVSLLWQTVLLLGCLAASAFYPSPWAHGPSNTSKNPIPSRLCWMKWREFASRTCFCQCMGVGGRFGRSESPLSHSGYLTSPSRRRPASLRICRRGGEFFWTIWRPPSMRTCSANCFYAWC
jgi:hypothetical protein